MLFNQVSVQYSVLKDMMMMIYWLIFKLPHWAALSKSLKTAVVCQFN